MCSYAHDSSGLKSSNHLTRYKHDKKSMQRQTVLAHTFQKQEYKLKCYSQNSGNQNCDGCRRHFMIR